MIIYKTTNLINGKIYVGKDSINNPDYLGSGLILNRAIKKYGIHNFKKIILEQCNTSQELDEKEKYWIKELNSTDKRIGYNIAKGGTGGDTFTNQPPYKKALMLSKLKSKRHLWDTPEYRKKTSDTFKKIWSNPSYKDHMIKVMTGREIKWSDKISKSITKWHKTNHLTENGRKRMIENGKKTSGREFKPISLELQKQIIDLYKTIGPKLISNQLNISSYLIIKLLKKEGIYQKWQKGIGEKSKKQASISRQGKNNPMYKNLDNGE